MAPQFVDKIVGRIPAALPTALIEVEICLRCGRLCTPAAGHGNEVFGTPAARDRRRIQRLPLIIQGMVTCWRSIRRIQYWVSVKRLGHCSPDSSTQSYKASFQDQVAHADLSHIRKVMSEGGFLSATEVTEERIVEDIRHGKQIVAAACVHKLRASGSKRIQTKPELERNRDTDWRRERDSNPRYAFTYTRVPGVRLKPLGHLSAVPAPRQGEAVRAVSSR